MKDMKRIVVVVAMLMAVAGLKAQDCDALVLPYFGGNVERLDNYKTVAPDKYMYRCLFAQTAFYESDTIPAGAELLEISDVVEWSTGKTLSRDIVIDLNTFSYYAYNFAQIQVRHDSVTEETCFATPGSRHPYLVLRSSNEMASLTNQKFQEYRESQQ